MPRPEISFALLLLVLLLRFMVLITVQAVVRMRHGRSLRWPEDAAHWGGSLAAPNEEGPVARVQAELRNDAESVPLFLIAAAFWLTRGAGPWHVGLTLAVYAMARSLHALWMVRPRQPHRNRAYAVGQLCLLYVVVDALRLSLSG